MTETLRQLLLRLSEGGEPAYLWGRDAARYERREVDRLVNAGTLVESGVAEEWEVCPSCCCGADVRPVQAVGDVWRAICPVDHRSDTVLTAEELCYFNIRVPTLIGEIARASGFRSPPSLMLPGLWHLGDTAVGRAVFLAITRVALAERWIVTALRDAACGRPITLLHPHPLGDAGASFVQAGFWLVPAAAALQTLKLDTRQLAPPMAGVRLVLHAARRMAVLDGIEIALPPQSLTVLKMLVEARLKEPAWVSGHDIEAALSQRTAADVVRDLKKVLNRSVKGSGSLIEGARLPGRYRLTLELRQVQLLP